MNWWREGDPAEHYWVEVTERPDVGIDLNAPQLDESGYPSWSHDLVKGPHDKAATGG